MGGLCFILVLVINFEQMLIMAGLCSMLDLVIKVKTETYVVGLYCFIIVSAMMFK